MPVPQQYSHRNKLLRDRGFGCYYDYLRSDLWRRIRREVLERDDFKCTDCGKPAKQVHHERYTYKNLFGESLTGLYSICRNCHRNRHGMAEEPKRRKRRRKKMSAKQRRHRARCRRQRLAKAARDEPPWCPLCYRNPKYDGGPCRSCRVS